MDSKWGIGSRGKNQRLNGRMGRFIEIGVRARRGTKTRVGKGRLKMGPA